MAPHFATSIARPGLLLLVSMLLGACGDDEGPQGPAFEIKVVEVVAKDVYLTQDFVGQTRGSTDIPIRARVEGFLESQNFVEGRTVEKDQLLYTIDPSPFRAKVVEAEGRLAEATTMLAKSRADLGRIRPLAEMKAVSQQDLDGAVAQRDAAEGSVQAAEAQVELANIQLGYTRIHSPIDGLIGISQVEVGEFVGSGPSASVLNFVSRSDPIRVRFSINERDYLRFAREEARRRREGIPDDVPNDEADRIKLILADGSIHDHAGSIVAGDAAIDPETGTFTLEADFPDPENIVLAGQFALARVVIDHREGALLVPQRAISELQGIFRVFVVADDGTTSLRTLDLGPEYGRYRIVNSGLEAGERVAIEGLLRLRDGMQVAAKVVKLEDNAGGAEG